MIATPFTELFGIDHPVVLAPMGLVSGGRLAATVTAAGGLGLLGGSYGDPNFICEGSQLLTAVGGVWGIGAVMFSFDRIPGLFELALAQHPPVMALSFGTTEQTVKYVSASKSAGAKVIVQIHDPEQAKHAVEAGADALIAQGSEAGGHHKCYATMPLVPAVVDAINDAIPVLAAGGIADGRGLAASLALGASGVMLGTRFVASVESAATDNVKIAMVKGRTADTRDNHVFDMVRGIEWIPGYQGRALENDFLRRWMGHETELTAKMETENLHDSYMQAMRDDNLSIKPVWAGQVLDLITSVKPAAQIVHDMVAQAETILNQQQLRVRRKREFQAI